MSEWQPLTDIYDTYSASLSTAIDEGFIDDPDTAENYIWPSELRMHELEQEDVKKYVADRMTEIIERVKREKGFNPNYLAGFIFRSVMCGMMWERERYGR